MPTRIFIPMLLAVALGGCATAIPEPLQGDYVQEPLPIAVAEGHRDQPVRWGGTLLGTLESERERCMVLLARPLDGRYRPLSGGEAAGRFLACDEKSIDLEGFLPGGDVTVVGVFDRFEESVDDDGVVRFPIVRIHSAYAWSMKFRAIEPFDEGQQGTRSSGAGPRAIDRYIDR